RLLFALMLGAATAGGSVFAGNDPPVFVEGQGSARTNPALAVDVRAQQAIDAATAAALIGALQTRFEGEQIELRLGTTRSERVSLRDLAIRGEADLRFGDSRAWLPVRFE